MARQEEATPEPTPRLDPDQHIIMLTERNRVLEVTHSPLPMSCPATTRDESEAQAGKSWVVSFASLRNLALHSQMEIHRERMQSSSTSSDEVLAWYRKEVERLMTMLETEQRDRDQASQAVLVRATARPRTPLTRFALCTLSLHIIL